MCGTRSWISSGAGRRRPEIGAGRFIGWLGVTASKFYDWRERYGRVERAQRLGSPGFLAGGLGEAGHHRLPSEESAGGLPAADVHDAGRRRRGGEPGQRVAGAGPSGAAAKVERQAVARKGTGFEQPPAAAPALAHRCFLHQHRGHVLLSVQRAGRLQPLHRALGSAASR